MSNHPRVGVYVDGFNLYFSLKRRGWKRFYWLDILKLCRALALQDQQVTVAKYFTARITGPPAKQARQKRFLEALTLNSPGLEIIYGRYQDKDINCKHCGGALGMAEEKQSDVAIGLHILDDAYRTATTRSHWCQGIATRFPRYACWNSPSRSNAG